MVLKRLQFMKHENVPRGIAPSSVVDQCFSTPSRIGQSVLAINKPMAWTISCAWMSLNRRNESSMSSSNGTLTRGSLACFARSRSRLASASAGMR